MSNYNVRGPHSNVTDQAPRVNENGKRSIRNFATALPGGINARRTHPRGPTSVPRIGTQLTIQSYASNIHQSTNNTSSTLLFSVAKKEQLKYMPGTLLFCCGTAHRLSKVRDLCEMNTDVDAECGNHRIVCGQAHSPTAFMFFGSMRGEVGRFTGKERLFNVDVRGRTKLPNMFGDVQRADRIGLGVVNVNPKAIDSAINKPNVIVPFVNGKVAQWLQNKVPDWEGCCQCISLGVVSNNACETPSESNMRKALHDRNRYTTLSQIEVLMV